MSTPENNEFDEGDTIPVDPGHVVTEPEQGRTQDSEVEVTEND